MKLIKNILMAVLTIIVVQTIAFSVGSNVAVAAQIVGDAVRGKDITSKWCVGCHVRDNKMGSDNAPPLTSIAAKGAKSPGFLRSFLAQPHAPMPPLQLNNQEIEDIAAYFGELSRNNAQR